MKRRTCGAIGAAEAMSASLQKHHGIKAKRACAELTLLADSVLARGRKVQFAARVALAGIEGLVAAHGRGKK